MAKAQGYEVGKTVGILGGGQLARMLAIEGTKLGLDMHVLSASDQDPAAQVTRLWHKGDINDQMALSEFFRAVGRVAIESEFLDEKLLLAAESASQTPMLPKIATISEIQDRLKQKTFL